MVSRKPTTGTVTASLDAENKKQSTIDGQDNKL